MWHTQPASYGAHDGAQYDNSLIDKMASGLQSRVRRLDFPASMIAKHGAWHRNRRCFSFLVSREPEFAGFSRGSKSKRNPPACSWRAIEGIGKMSSRRPTGLATLGFRAVSAISSFRARAARSVCHPCQPGFLRRTQVLSNSSSSRFFLIFVIFGALRK